MLCVHFMKARTAHSSLAAGADAVHVPCYSVVGMDCIECADHLLENSCLARISALHLLIASGQLLT